MTTTPVLFKAWIEGITLGTPADGQVRFDVNGAKLNSLIKVNYGGNTHTFPSKDYVDAIALGWNLVHQSDLGPGFPTALDAHDTRFNILGKSTINVTPTGNGVDNYYGFNLASTRNIVRVYNKGTAIANFVKYGSWDLSFTVAPGASETFLFDTEVIYPSGNSQVPPS